MWKNTFEVLMSQFSLEFLTDHDEQYYQLEMKIKAILLFEF